MISVSLGGKNNKRPLGTPIAALVIPSLNAGIQLVIKLVS